MINYPVKTYNQYSVCIKLDTFPKANDKLVIYTTSGKDEIILSSLQVDALLKDHDTIIKYEKYLITFDMENQTFYIECLIRDIKFELVYLEHDETNRISYVNVRQPTPRQMRLPLNNVKPGLNDTLSWSINGKTYQIIFDNKVLDAIKTETGFVTRDRHIVKLESTNYKGNHLIVIATYLTDTFTANMVYTNSQTITQINSSYKIDVIGSTAFTSGLNDLVRENDIITCLLKNGTIITKTLTSNDLLQLNSYGQIVDDPQILIKLGYDYSGPLTFHILTIESKDPVNIIFDRVDYRQPIATVKTPHFRIFYDEIRTTSNPLYDTYEELCAYTRGELDHIKGRCICSLRSIFQRLKDLKQLQNAKPTPTSPPKYTPTEIQDMKDYIMDYGVYPCTCDLSIKQYLWDTYGPFTSPRPDVYYDVLTMYPYQGAVSVKCQSEFYIDFTGMIKSGSGLITFTPI